MCKVLFGVEIETIIDTIISNNNNGIGIGSYHNGRPWLDTAFTAELDGSLSIDWDQRGCKYYGISKEKYNFLQFNLYKINTAKKYYLNYHRLSCVEFVSHVYSDTDLFLSDLRDLVAATWPMYFNMTTGCHIHLSFVDTSFVPFIVTSKHLKIIRSEVFKKLEAYSPSKFKMFLDFYYRQYARRRPYSNKLNGERYSEFYLSPDKGIEWRSFNLVPCSSQEDIIFYLTAAVETINENMDIFLNEGFKNSKKYNINISDFNNTILSEREIFYTSLNNHNERYCNV